MTPESCPLALLCAAGRTVFHHCTFCLHYLVTAPVQAVHRAPYDVQHVVVPYLVCPRVTCAFFVNPNSSAYRDHCPKCIARHDMRLTNWVAVTV